MNWEVFCVILPDKWEGSACVFTNGRFIHRQSGREGQAIALTKEKGFPYYWAYRDSEVVVVGPA